MSLHFCVFSHVKMDIALSFLFFFLPSWKDQTVCQLIKGEHSSACSPNGALFARRLAVIDKIKPINRASLPPAGTSTSLVRCLPVF